MPTVAIATMGIAMHKIGRSAKKPQWNRTLLVGAQGGGNDIRARPEWNVFKCALFEAETSPIFSLISDHIAGLAKRH